MLTDDLRTAAEWLECYEPGNPETEAIQRVAVWLRSRADALELRAICREAGVRVSDVRARMRSDGRRN